MRTLDEEYNLTTKKMADTVMEYAAQFVARGFLDEYKRAEKKPRNIVFPESFDERISKRISGVSKKKPRSVKRIFRNILIGIASFIILFCVGMTILVLTNGVLRSALLEVL